MEEQNKKNQKFSPQQNEPTDESRVEDLLQNYKHTHTNQKQNLKSSQQNQTHPKPNYLLQHTCQKWLTKKGKGYMIDFNREQKKKLKIFFNLFDKNNMGIINVQQIQFMLISLGFIQNIQEINNRFFDKNKLHHKFVNFQEFLKFVKDQNLQHKFISQYIRELVFQECNTNKFMEKYLLADKKTNIIHKNSKNPPKPSILNPKISFQLSINQIKRNYILSSMNIGRYKTINNTQNYIKCNKKKQIINALHILQQKKLIRQGQENIVKNNGNYQEINKQKYKDISQKNKKKLEYQNLKEQE